MKTLTLPTLLLLTAGVAAQTTTYGQTATAYGCAAQAGTAYAIDTKPKGTAMPPALSTYSTATKAYARSYANTYKTYLYTQEYASAYVATGSTDKAEAGTTTDKTGSIGDGHAIEGNLESKAGQKGQIVIYWSPYLMGSGNTIQTVVNVDGKDVATFTQASPAGETRVDTTVGTSGSLKVTITNSSKASQSAAGRSYHSTYCRVSFLPGYSAGKCTITAFGKDCGLKMTGSSLLYENGSYAYHRVQLDLDGMSSTEAGLLGVGPKLTTPVTLPAGSCQLLVNPVLIAPIRYRNTLTFRNTDAAISTSAQAVKVTLDASGVKLSSSNGLDIICPKL